MSGICMSKRTPYRRVINRFLSVGGASAAGRSHPSANAAVRERQRAQHDARKGRSVPAKTE
jgi:hypothetical protein